MTHIDASSEREHRPFFVYGTLRPGEENYQLFAAGKTLREVPAVSRTVDYVAEDGNSRRITAWVYLGGRATVATYTETDRVPSGDWFAYLRASGRKEQ